MYVFLLSFFSFVLWKGKGRIFLFWFMLQWLRVISKMVGPRWKSKSCPIAHIASHVLYYYKKSLIFMILILLSVTSQQKGGKGKEKKKKKSRLVQLQDSDNETNDSIEYRSVCLFLVFSSCFIVFLSFFSRVFCTVFLFIAVWKFPRFIHICFHLIV